MPFRFTLCTLAISCVLPALLGGVCAAQRIDQATGFTLAYEGKDSFAEYATNHPLIAGTWVAKSETEKYWIGDLHYPTDNTGVTKDFYVLLDIRVAKTKKLNIAKAESDEQKWRTLVLLKPGIEHAPQQQEATIYEAVAMGLKDDKNSFLFKNKFRFAPSKITGVLKRHEAAHTKRSMLTGNYHIHTRFGAIEVMDTRAISTEQFDKLHNKKVVATGLYKGNRELVVKGDELEQRPAVQLPLGPAGFPLRPSFTPDKITIAR